MGDHTDYNGGFVLPLAIDRACSVTAADAFGSPGDRRLGRRAGAVEVAVDGGDDPRDVVADLGPLRGGFGTGARRAGRTVAAAELTISSTVPVGSGLSSSSALSVALTQALADLAGAPVAGVDVARLASAAEIARHRRARRAHGPARARSSAGPGMPLLIDCRVLVGHPGRRSRRGSRSLVVHSGVPRTLVGTAYASRRRRVRGGRSRARPPVAARRHAGAGA